MVIKNNKIIIIVIIIIIIIKLNIYNLYKLL